MIISKNWFRIFVNYIDRAISEIDRPTLLVIFSLIGIGLVQVYSSSFIFATESYGDGLFFFKKQLVFAAAAVVILLVTTLIPWRVIEKLTPALWAFTLFMLALTFVPGVARTAGGATRWIQLPFAFRFEPSELMKTSVVLILAHMMVRRSRFFIGWTWVIPILIVGLPLTLLLKQPDFGSFAICALTILMLFFIYGLRWSYIVGAFAVMMPLFYFLVMRVPYRRARILAFLDPWSDPANGGFQVIQSLLSFHSGGVTGVGLGQSQGKLFFLPEAHTDFTFSILSEESGFVGFVFMMILFGYLLLRGLQIGVKIQNPFARLTVLGLTISYGIKVAINTGVTLGLLPTKGLALPFLSYGGSSLLMLAFSFGVILNAQRTFAEPHP